LFRRVARTADPWLDSDRQGVRARFAFGFVVVTACSAALAYGCDINPQPEVPSYEEDGTDEDAGVTANPGPTKQRDDDGADEYDDLDPNLGAFTDDGDASDAALAPDERPDAMPPVEVREDAGVPGVVN
jgi:hypothetical protein